MIRISTAQAFSNSVSGIQRAYANAMKAQDQLSSGYRITTAGDDPVAYVRLQKLDQQQSAITQYQSNLTSAQNGLAEEEGALNSVNNVLQQVRDVAGQAGNGSLALADRQALATQLKQYEDQLVGLANTKDSNGSYMFSGFQGKTQPFVRGADGTYSYQGDEGQRTLQVGATLSVAVNDSGENIFENVLNAGRLTSSITTAPAGSSLQVSSPLVTDELSFSSFPATGISIRFDDPTNTSAYHIYDAADTAVPPTALASGSMDTDTSSSDSVVFRGVSIQLDGSTVGGEAIQVSKPAGSDQKQSILNTVVKLRSVLESSTDANTIRDAVAESLTNIDNGIQSVDATRSRIGARLNALDATQSDNESQSIQNQSVQSDLRDVDYAEAASRLSLQTTVLQAAQQAYVKVSGLSLFNFM